MTDTLEYLLTFRKCSSLDSLEKVYDKLNYSIENDTEISNMYRAADHRRAELVAGKCSIWAKCRKRCGRRCFNSAKLRAATVLSFIAI